MTTEPVARIGAPEDWANWRDIRLRALEGAPDAFGSTLERERAFRPEVWRERLADGNCVLVFLDGAAVAMGAGFREVIDGQEWFHIVAMWTDPQHRGQRLSHRVLELLIARAESLGLPAHLDVALGNEVALGSYAAYGFVPEGEPFVEDAERDLRCQRLVLRRPR